MKQGTVYYQQAGLQQWPKTRHIALLKMIIIVKGKKSQIQLCIVFISQSASINEKKKCKFDHFVSITKHQPTFSRQADIIGLIVSVPWHG